MKKLIDFVLDGAGLVVMGIFVLLIFSLGAFVGIILVEFGWIGVLAVAAFTIIGGTIQGWFETAITKPFRGIWRLFKGAPPAPEPEASKKDLRKQKIFGLGIALIFLTGAMTALVLHLTGLA